ncbi:hypothetical protein [Vibrio nigripulchritudo]|uniref:hypothetical protein n=1 Tax=Vibrio nigripulchritudo TaxID=28173 RepID=UPI0005F9BA5E|nr:hypothetical protein [Vibrio nigripulchritudo]KJY67266.1 hypothetical protein TW74_27140 [Vibrio nigripulchritudo]
MKSLFFTTVVGGVLLLQGCAHTETPKAPAKITKPVTIDQPEIMPQTFMLHGEMVLGHETRSLAPCGGKQQYWLDMPVDTFQRVEGLVSRPYQPLYAELIGYLAPPPQEGFAADFTARFVVTGVNHVSAESPSRCAKPLHPTFASGQTPAWKASIEKDALRISQIGKQDSFVPITRTAITPNKREYFSKSGNLTLTRAHCVDSRSGDVFSWKAELNNKSTALQGCAALSNGDSSHDWLGSYRARSTQTDGFSVQLELNADHTAFTHYHYSNGDPSTQESGYWQQLNPNQVMVTMTHYQSQPLLSERIYTRKGSSLKAIKEKVNGIVYPIQGDGLELFADSGSYTQQLDAPDIKANAPLKDATVASSNEFDSQVDKAVRQYFTLHKTDPKNTRYRWLKYDLNQDGRQELLTYLDWCGAQGCTLLIFENKGSDQWRFHSRITQVTTPFKVSQHNKLGWHDLELEVTNGGKKSIHSLSFDGISYPVSPSSTPELWSPSNAVVSLFSDAQPPQTGVKM